MNTPQELIAALIIRINDLYGALLVERLKNMPEKKPAKK
jgi:hypothetical protein